MTRIEDVGTRNSFVTHFWQDKLQGATVMKGPANSVAPWQRTSFISYCSFLHDLANPMSTSTCSHFATVTDDIS